MKTEKKSKWKKNWDREVEREEIFKKRWKMWRREM